MSLRDYLAWVCPGYVAGQIAEMLDAPWLKFIGAAWIVTVTIVSIVRDIRRWSEPA